MGFNLEDLMLKLVILCLSLSIAFFVFTNQISAQQIKMNASKNKLEEFQTLFSNYGITLDTSSVDLKEIDADPLLVAVQKASQIGQKILVEDTSLDIEGADVGIHIKWLLETLQEHVGKKATWRVLMAYREGDMVKVYEGKVTGTIVYPRGEGGFGFDPIFLPDGASKTLAEDKPYVVNARYYAVKNFVENNPVATLPAIDNWQGSWQ